MTHFGHILGKFADVKHFVQEMDCILDDSRKLWQWNLMLCGSESHQRYNFLRDTGFCSWFVKKLWSNKYPCGAIFYKFALCAHLYIADRNFRKYTSHVIL